MIRFFHDSNNHHLILQINGWFGGLIIMYLLVEFSFFIITKTFFIHKMIMGLRVRNQIKKMLPNWWYIEKLSFITINKMKGDYEVYVKVRSKIPTGGHHIYGDNTCTTNDWVKVNWLGTIKVQSLMASIFSADIDHQSEIKQWSREKALEKIGI